MIAPWGKWSSKNSAARLRFSWSSPVKGSSKIARLLPRAAALAMATRRAIPPLRAPGRQFHSSSSPKAARNPSSSPRLRPGARKPLLLVCGLLTLSYLVLVAFYLCRLELIPWRLYLLIPRYIDSGLPLLLGGGWYAATRQSG